MDSQSPSLQSYTILRIKRKRTEEPLDALVVESRVRRKKSRGGIGVFQFAQTVEQDAWEDEKRRRDLQEEISRIARETSAKDESKATAALPPASPTISRHKDEPNRRYKIIPQNHTDPDLSNELACPPVVLPAKDLPLKNANDFKMYDAVLSAEQAPSPIPDPEMDKFMPMLNDYLKLHDISPAASVYKMPKPSATLPTLRPSVSTPDDYVWDVFYHRPATLGEWNEAANVATLTGLPPSITDPYDSASDSEEEDEADEDSNAEEYYKNDYPDEETSDGGSSDEFHEDSENEDIVAYQDDGDDHEWR